MKIDSIDIVSTTERHLTGGVGASLDPEELLAWDKEHRDMLKENAPEQFVVKHYVSMAELAVKK